MLIRAGYNCLTLETDIMFKSFFLKSVLDNDVEKITQVINHNICALGDLVEFNLYRDIRLFRISSGLIPFCNNEQLIRILNNNEILNNPKVLNEFKRIKDITKQYGIRLSTHPGQYNVLNSNRIDVVKKTIRELKFHAMLLDLVGGDIIVLHIGSSKFYGKEKSKEIFIQRAKDYLPPSVLSKLTIENDDVSYNTDDVIDVIKELGVKWVYDIHHERINSSKNLYKNLREYHPTKCHVCDGLNGKLVRTHDSWVSVKTLGLLKDQLTMSEIYKMDVMFESKNKDTSLLDSMRNIGDGYWEPLIFNKRDLR